MYLLFQISLVSQVISLWNYVPYILESQHGLGIFLFTTVSILALGPTQPPIEWVSGALPLGVKQPGCEADHSPPSIAKVKNVWSYTSTPPISLHCMVL